MNSRRFMVFARKGHTNDVPVVFSTAIHHALDDTVQTGDIAAAGENSDAFVRHDDALVRPDHAANAMFPLVMNPNFADGLYGICGALIKAQDDERI